MIALSTNIVLAVTMIVWSIGCGGRAILTDHVCDAGIIGDCVCPSQFDAGYAEDSGTDASVIEWQVVDIVPREGNSAELLAIGDFNGDGHKDMVVGSTVQPDMGDNTNHARWLYFGRGDGTFEEPRRLPTIPAGQCSTDRLVPCEITIDLDGDLVDDLVINGDHKIYLSLGNINFDDALQNLEGGIFSDFHPSSIVLPIDFNHDGKSDLIADGDSTSISTALTIAINRSEPGRLIFDDFKPFSFSMPTLPLPTMMGNNRMLTTVSDIDGDGLQDPVFTTAFVGDGMVMTGFFSVLYSSVGESYGVFFVTPYDYYFDLFSIGGKLMTMFSWSSPWGNDETVKLVDFTYGSGIRYPQNDVNPFPVRFEYTLNTDSEAANKHVAVGAARGIISQNVVPQLVFAFTGAFQGVFSEILVLDAEMRLIYSLRNEPNATSFLPIRIGLFKVADFDEDGWDDLAFSNTDNGTVRVLLNRLHK